MKRHTPFLAIICLTLLLVTNTIGVPTSLVDTARAQEFVYNSQSAAAELRQLKTQYRSEIEEYRRLENQYQIAQTQYKQLDTLASLESAVRSTQNAMQSRSKVMKTYVQLLRVALVDQPGVDLAAKEQALTELDALQNAIEQHQQVIAGDLNKAEVQQVAQEFKSLADQFEQTSYHVQALLKVGELQTVYDKAKQLTADIEKNRISSLSEIQKAQQQRSVNEVNQLLSQAENLFNQVEDKFVDPGTQGYKTIYNRTQDTLTEIYGSLSRTTSFLQEILNS